MALICDPCETVAHCSRFGCIPLAPAAQAPASSFTVVGDELAHLQQDFADEACKHLVETSAEWVPSKAPRWVYDVSRLDADVQANAEDPDAELATLRRAVRYLDLRGLLARPIENRPECVSFWRGS